jgi:hypothetical protein
MRAMKWMVAAIAIAALGGCATNGQRTNAGPQSSFEEDVDFQKMAIITEDALSRGYQIVWVHPPQKRHATSR